MTEQSLAPLGGIYNALLKKNLEVDGRFMCVNDDGEITDSIGACGHIVDAQSPEFLEWAEKERPDLLGKLHLVSCTCDQTVERIDDDLTKRKARLVQQANLPRRLNDPVGGRTFINFQTVKGIEAMVSRCKQFADLIGPPHLVISGRTGIGKTHLLEAVCRQMLDNNITVHYTSAKGLLDRLRSSIPQGETYQLQEYYKKDVQLLALDEIGTEHTTDYGADALLDIVNERYADGSRTIYATNANSPEEIAAKWGARLASRLFDRSSDVVHVEFSNAQDFRLVGG